VIAVSGIVLAGGRSSRFGSDKLGARVDCERLLDRSVAALAGIATEVLVVAAPEGERRVDAPGGVPVRLVHDPVAFEGPLVGLLAGLELAPEPIVVAVGGDMPSLVPDVLVLLVRRLLSDPDRQAAALMDRGRVAQLPSAVRAGAATAIARQLTADGERRLGALTERLSTVAIDEAEWRPLDPDGATLRDVDRPDDLDRSSRR
jgi:molybdopterin-guanine dinucleotide biosynthesis protein A